MPLSFSEHESISLKSHPEFSESWLQNTIAENPGLIGLGELEVIDRERIQHGSGRLDLLLEDGDSTRYEVELMLGATDPSHIIRCIEYWDNERRKYPGYEHIAVLIAEDITSRFLNIINLMAGNIPIVAIQLNALKVGEQLILNFTKVLDQTSLRSDDRQKVVYGGEVVSRSVWEQKVGDKIMQIADSLLKMTTELSDKQLEMKYLKGRLTISVIGDWRNLLVMYPKKQYLHLVTIIEDADHWIEAFAESGLTATKRRHDRVQVDRKSVV